MMLLEAIREFLGAYTPVMTTVEQVLPDGSIHSYEAVASGFAGVDWPWLVSAALLLLFIFCMFKLLGVIFRG